MPEPIADLDDLIRKCDAATPGPWLSVRYMQPAATDYKNVVMAPGYWWIVGHLPELDAKEGTVRPGADADLVAACSPEVVRALCEIAREALAFKNDPNGFFGPHLERMSSLIEEHGLVDGASGGRT